MYLNVLMIKQCLYNTQSNIEKLFISFDKNHLHVTIREKLNDLQMMLYHDVFKSKTNVNRVILHL